MTAWRQCSAGKNLYPGIYIDVTLTLATYLNIFVDQSYPSHGGSTVLQKQPPLAKQQWGLRKRHKNIKKNSEEFNQPPNSPDTNLVESGGICGRQTYSLETWAHSPQGPKDLWQTTQYQTLLYNLICSLYMPWLVRGLLVSVGWTTWKSLLKHNFWIFRLSLFLPPSWKWSFPQNGVRDW